MTESAITEYQSATREYLADRTSAAEMFKFITTAADAMAYKQIAFLTLQFGVQAPADEVMNIRNDARNHRYDMAKWPSYDEMKSTIEKWHASFKTLNEAWYRIPQDERTALLPPPKMMQTT